MQLNACPAMKHVCALSVLLTVTCASVSVADVGLRKAIRQDWQQWRGPRRDGISHETGLSVDWTERTPAVLWERPLPSGYSAISIVGDRLYTMGKTDDKEYVFCLNAADGTTIWKAFSGDTFTKSYDEGPRSTPTVDGELVYTLGGTGALMCSDVDTGEEIWKVNILEEFGAKNIHWGVSTSPLVDGPNLLVNVGAEAASVVAFDKVTGGVRWQAHDDIAGYSAPIKIDVTGSADVISELVFFCGKALVGMSPSDGAEHWRHEWITTDNMNIATPIYDPKTRLLFVSASRNTGRCAAYRLTAENGRVTSELVYTNKDMRNHFNSCVLLDGFVYGFDNALLKCLELSTGEIKWSDRSVGKGSLLAAQGHLYVLGQKGDLAVVEATSDEYREKGRIKPLDSSRAWTPPALSRGRLYVRDLENIACIDVAAAD